MAQKRPALQQARLLIPWSVSFPGMLDSWFFHSKRAGYWIIVVKNFGFSGHWIFWYGFCFSFPNLRVWYFSGFSGGLAGAFHLLDFQNGVSIICYQSTL